MPHLISVLLNVEVTNPVNYFHKGHNDNLYNTF